ncbi:hypothetical protein HPB52_005752 [Rhipicephalus sanguineus]|uniref:Uncharacterized protein n=1 Tax=Rhipicephalus sanguineus TaxID=34632 RepID=A0A9D4SXR3_RHISA|nr:hypothetical protein HPB52_005752 [Rhipicephalus sanguineus]
MAEIQVEILKLRAAAGMEGDNLQLEVNNANHRKVNEETGICLPGDVFEEEYEEAIQYDDRTNRAMGLLKAKIAAVQASAITSSSIAIPPPQLPKLHL